MRLADLIYNRQMKIFKHLLLIWAFWCGANSAFAQTWTQTGASTNFIWTAVASSADGTKLAAAASAGGIGIWVSTNSGATWTKTSASTNNDWSWVASSADGTKLVAMDGYYGVICTSADSGTTWTKDNVPNWAWRSIALSADGTKLVASATDPAFNEYIFTSADSGTTWTSNSMPVTFALSVASSADGTKLVAAANEGYIFTSTNSGATWHSSGFFPGVDLHPVASSADGTKLITGGGISTSPFMITSTNSGVTWTTNNVPGVDHMRWQAFASSADGNTLVAVAGSDVVSAASAGPIFISTNSGTTWALTDAPYGSWSGVASSADGSKLVGSASPGRLGFPAGGIYTAQTTPAPQLDLTPTNGNLLLSWILPSTNFMMQQSSDLTSWADMTNAPVLNLTKLQNEVILSSPGSNVFYRLKTP
jgi:photosystem II stability/assembly factor-like uncharacterized protein